MLRSSGVLMPISSLPNHEGIGTFGQSAYHFIDFLVNSGQTYWQILPLGTTSYGDSPYQSFSAFAGNTYFIDLEILYQWGLLEKNDYENISFGKDPENIDYATLFHTKRPLLEKAVKKFLQDKPNWTAYQDFIRENEKWLIPFAQYMACKEHFLLEPVSNWDPAIRLRQEPALSQLLAQQKDVIDYHLVTQFFFFRQWYLLKEYANQNHIQIIGDMPIYVSGDSVEMWQMPHFFKVDDNGQSTLVAGCPPDGFTEGGQLWGNPIYNWDAMAEDHYQWWIWRIQESLKLYDVVRIDHFRGFESFWEIPFGSKDAAPGHWAKGPGYALFKAVKEALGDVHIIAEDLGYPTPEVAQLLKDCGFPGMHVLEFAFDGNDSIELPHNYDSNSVAYVGTHDNQTGLGWYLTASDQEKACAENYIKRHPEESVPEMLNRAIAASPANTAIYTMQDLLELDDRARINIPSTLGGNWQWRMLEGQLTPALADKLRQLTQIYHRLNPAYKG